MESIIYQKTAAVEESHWWFSGRRRLVQYILDELPLPKNSQILEIGCGTGGNLALLSKYGELHAIEPHDSARLWAENRGLAHIRPGSLPDGLPYDKPRFDLVVMTDVLEHVAKDLQALKRVRQILKADGHIVVTVPATPCLWSDHDVLHHHQRRYTRRTLTAIFLQAGYRIRFISYTNMILFPLIAAARLGKTRFGTAGTDDLAMPPALINHLLQKIFAGERHLFKLGALPFGVSLLLLATPRSPQPE